MQKRILIAEDSNIVLSIVSRILQNMNYEVEGVKNGTEVLEQLKTNTFDLILMDISMPRMDGISCVNHIRKHESKESKEIPIIAISGNALNLSEKKYLELGFNGIIEKPINFDLLAKEIFKILDK